MVNITNSIDEVRIILNQMNLQINKNKSINLKIVGQNQTVYDVYFSQVSVNFYSFCSINREIKI
jgi:hypothetical protein